MTSGANGSPEHTVPISKKYVEIQLICNSKYVLKKT